MANKSTKNIADFIVPLNINGLNGRMLCLPAPKNKSREILFVYGHHSSLERWEGVVMDLNKYGTVTVPDLPGFGGMQSFYKIKREPTIDNLADYLASFIKLRYKRKKITIIGLSLGFVITTRMLQKYPDICKKVNLLISVAGFTHKNDFTFSKLRHYFYLNTARLLTKKAPSVFFRNVLLHPWVLKTAYRHTHNARQKFQSVNRADNKKAMDIEVRLWHMNDVRTWAHTSVEFLQLDNTRKQVDMPMWHIAIDADRYFNNYLVEQHLNIIFSKVNVVYAEMDTHAPSVIADVKTAAPLIPKEIRKLLKND